MLPEFMPLRPKSKTMTMRRLSVIIALMLTGTYAFAQYQIDLTPDASKRRTVTIYRSHGPKTASLYLNAPDPWYIGHSSIVARDDVLWEGPVGGSSSPSKSHIYNMLSADSSEQYVCIFGDLVQPGVGPGYNPWFRATVPSVDIDWESHAKPSDEANEDSWTGFCPVTTNQSERTKVIIRKMKDDTSLVYPSMTLKCWPTDAVRFMKANGTTALYNGATINNSDAPLTLYVDPLSTGPFEVTLQGPIDDEFKRPEDYLKGHVGSLALDSDLWWFGGEDPGGGYHVESILAVTPFTSGSFKWDVTEGASIVSLNNGGADSDSITATDDSTIMVKSTGASSSVEDVTIALTYNGVAVSSYSFTVRKPGTPQLITWYPMDDIWGLGYKTTYRFKVLDQFGAEVPFDMPINESFGAWTSDVWYEQWDEAEPNGLMTTAYSDNPHQFKDDYGASQLIPPSVAPGDLHADEPVKHVTQYYRAGSLTPGVGILIKTHTLQMYKGKGRQL